MRYSAKLQILHILLLAVVAALWGDLEALAQTPSSANRQEDDQRGESDRMAHALSQDSRPNSLRLATGDGDRTGQVAPQAIIQASQSPPKRNGNAFNKSSHNGSKANRTRKSPETNREVGCDSIEPSG
jgi:hypothetical protein